jgi:outer membrane receptor protein involved in Fe transport
VVVILFAAPLSSFAQSPNTATIMIRAIDIRGEALPDAHVTITNEATGGVRHAVTGADGLATVAGLPVGGTYRVVVSKPGLHQYGGLTDHLTLRAGETARIDVVLATAFGDSGNLFVSVFGTAQGIRTDPELGVRLDSGQIDVTPLLGRKISYLPLLNASFRQAKGTGDLFLNTVYFVTGAGGRRQADFVVDGATGDEPWGRQAMFSTIPVGAVQEMNVMSRAFSAEFGWTSSAAINIVTKAGTNAAHGEALVLGRPGGLQPSSFADDASVGPPDIPDSLLQVSLAIGGALAPDRTHYFFAGDLTRQDRTASISTPLVPAGTTFVGNYRQALANARLDHKLTAGQSLMARVNLDRFYDTNPQDAVSGNVLPSAGRQFTRHTYGGQVNDTSILSASMLNEARFEYQHADPVTAFDPISPSTQFTRAGTAPFTSGESRFVHAFSRLSQLSDTLTWTRDKHYLRLGGSAAHSSSGGDGTEFGAAFVLGQYTVNTATTKPPDQLLLSDIQRYQQSFNLGEGAYELNQWLVSLFAQDSVRVRNDLTIDLGVRYDRQTFTDGTKNVSPRVGFGWNPGGDSNTAVRGGYGLYYTQIRANTAANFELGGPQGIFTYQAAPGQTGFPACLACTPVVFDSNASRNTLPARNITIRPGLASFYAQFFDISKLIGYGAATFENPRSQVGSIGIERQIAPRVFVSADYVTQHWTGLDRSVDLNAPSFFPRTAPGQVRSTTAADATRPIVPVNGGFRTISVVENLGVADYDGLQTMARWQGARGFASVSYTLSKATNTTEPDGNGAAQSDFNQLGEEERGPSLLDQRHRAVIALAYRAPFNITAGSVMQFASARPFNPTIGVDNNGDGNNNDRPVLDGALAGRYSFRGTPTSDVALFAEGGVKMAGRSLLLRIEGFNVFNHPNILGRNGTYGDTATPLPTFGHALPGLPNVDPGRMVQFEAKLVF